MTISRAQMNRQLYQMGGMGVNAMPMDYGQPLQVSQPMMNPSFGPMQPMMNNPMSNYGQTPLMMARGGIASLVDREKYGLGSKLKKFVRKIIPNEVAKIAVKAAPFVAPFNPLLAGAMAGIGGFDQTGRIGSSLKSAALTYGAGQIARGIGGAGFQEGFNPFAGADFSGGFTSGLGSLFTSPMGNLPFGSFSTPTSAPINLTPTQVDFTGIDDYGQLGYKPGYTVSGGGPTAVGNPRDVYDPTIDYSGAGTRYEGFTSDDLLKTAPSPAPIKEQGYVDLIKKAGSFENVPLSERFNAVKDLSSKALTDLYTKPIINPKTGETTNVLDKTALFATFAGASSYYEALQLAKKAGIPESEFSEADYQRLKIDPEKAKYKDTLKDEAFGIRKAEGGRIGYGLGDLVRSSGVAVAIPGGNVSESRGLGGMIQRLIQQNPQMFRTQMSASRRDFIDNDNNGIDDREEAAGGGLMDGGVLSIKLTPAQAMAMGGRIGYQEGTKPGFTPPSKPSLVEDFYKSSFYDPKAMGTTALVPVTLPTGEKFTFSGGADSAGFEKYVKSLGYSTNRGDGIGYNVIAPTPVPSPTVPAPTMPTPGLTAPIVETPISVAEQVQQFIGKGTPAVNEEFIINRRRQAEQDAAARVTPGITPIITPPTFSIPTSPSMNDREYADLNPNKQIPYMNNPIYQNFLQSPFYKSMTPGLTVMTPVKLPTGEFFNLPDSARANQFRQYLSSTPAGGAPVQSNSQSFTLPNIYKTGGRVNYFMGSEIPVRQNQGGITELDLRAKGGYIPVGIKEKADDVPAMLSRNEFVFTADAVRGAGGGNINKGAQKMYKLMKSLEKKVKKMKKVA